MIKYLQIMVLTLCVSDISNYHAEKTTNFDEYSYVVSIWRNTEFLCSGTIINKRHILTKALCISNIPSSELSVLAGIPRTDYEPRTILRVNHIHIHYDFSTVLFWAPYELCGKNDIAVLQLQHKLIWHIYMQPSSLFAGSSSESRVHKCKVTGWKPIPGVSIYHFIWIEAKILADDECELHKPFENEKCLSVDTRALITSTKFNGNSVICNGLIVGMITRRENNNAIIFLDSLHYLDFITNAIDDGKTDVECGEEPYIVSIWNQGFYKCGGIIITDNHILTSAHCILSADRIDLRIVIGLCQILPRNRRIEWLLVDRVRIDCIAGFGILMIKPRSIWDPIRTPAVFLPTLDVSTNQTCEVFRWHRAYNVDGETLMQLVRTSEKILSDQECRESGVYLEENQFCTTGPYSHHSANIENIGNPIVCAGMVLGIMIPTDTNSTLPSRFTTFLKIAAYTEKLSAITLL